MWKLATTALLFTAVVYGGIIGDVRQATSAGEFGRAERLIASYRGAKGVTPEMVLALSWLGRGALEAHDYQKAERYAGETRQLVLKMLEERNRGGERQILLALGASIEVRAQVLAARGSLSEAVTFLNGELARWSDASLRTRIQKNINLLSLVGKPAPPLDLSEYLGPKPAPLTARKGKVLILFFWAHWCPDCKYEVPILARLQREYGSRGLVIIGPSRCYGFVARGRDASPAEERRYIDRVRAGYYGAVKDMSVPLGKQNFVEYGSSTVPTLVLVDREGIVRLYHPGQMPYEDLAPKVAKLLRGCCARRRAAGSSPTDGIHRTERWDEPVGVDFVSLPLGLNG